MEKDYIKEAVKGNVILKLVSGKTNRDNEFLVRNEPPNAQEVEVVDKKGRLIETLMLTPSKILIQLLPGNNRVQRLCLSAGGNAWENLTWGKVNKKTNKIEIQQDLPDQIKAILAREKKKREGS